MVQAGTEDTGDEGADADTDFFDSIDPTTVGKLTRIYIERTTIYTGLLLYRAEGLR